jgi:hypothetical protein
MIGPDWTGRAARRMANPSDHIRRELEIALAAGVAIVPVLVWRAEMPPDRELPESVRDVARLNAIELSDNQWASDVAALIDRLQRMAWAGAHRPPEPGGLGVRATVPLTPAMGRGGVESCSLLAASGGTLVASPKTRRLWWVLTDEPRVVRVPRPLTRPFWRPTALAFGYDGVFVADTRGKAVWRMRPGTGVRRVSSTDSDALETVRYERPDLGRVRRARAGGPTVSVAVVRGAATEPPGVWAVVSSPETGRHELLRLEPSRLRIDARISLPGPGRVAVGAGAVWVTTADVVAKIDAARNLIQTLVPLGFEPDALAVDDDGVWVGRDRLVARIDPYTAQVLGVRELPAGPVETLALGAGALWVGTASSVHRIDVRSNDVVDSLNLEEGVLLQIQDIAVYETTVQVAVESRVEALQDSFLALIDA